MSSGFCHGSPAFLVPIHGRKGTLIGFARVHSPNGSIEAGVRVLRSAVDSAMSGARPTNLNETFARRILAKTEPASQIDPKLTFEVIEHGVPITQSGSAGLDQAVTRAVGGSILARAGKEAGCVLVSNMRHTRGIEIANQGACSFARNSTGL